MNIALIACGKSKRDTTSHAVDLYTGALFKKSLAYAKDMGFDKIFILSAKHGLLELDDVVEPYEYTLIGKPKRRRLQWAERVKSQLPAGNYTYLAGKLYREFLPDGECPVVGLPIGKQLQWYKERGY